MPHIFIETSLRERALSASCAAGSTNNPLVWGLGQLGAPGGLPGYDRHREGFAIWAIGADRPCLVRSPTSSGGRGDLGGGPASRRLGRPLSRSA
jgi:hypothetical protein